ncbi:hypothetical protein OSTOST_25811 [Ostertagia ostertagi]
MRQSKEEFDSLSKSEMKELEDVLRSSEEERRRLEMERGKEEELFSRALAVTNESEKTDQKREGLTATSSSRTEATPLVTKNAELKATSEGAASKSSNTVEGSETVGSAGSADSKPSRAATAKKDRRESTGERPPTMNTLAPSERDRRASVGDKSPTTKTSAPPEKTPPRTRGNGRPPTAKRGNTPSGGVGERAALKSVKDRRPSAMSFSRLQKLGSRKRTISSIRALERKLKQSWKKEGILALLREPNRLNSATIRSREEYLRMQRDRLLAMKANEREKQMNFYQRAAQERPRTARAARGLMRGSRGGIGTDDVLAARRAIVDQLKTEIEESSTS